MSTRRWSLTVLSLLALACGSGCGVPSPEADAKLSQYSEVYRQGHYEEVVRQTTEFLRDYSYTSAVPEAHYLRGMARSRLKDASGAETDLNEAIRLTHHAEVKGKAMVELGELAFGRDNVPAAEAHFRQALQNLPEGKSPADIALYRLGCLYQRQGKWSEADEQFSQVMYKFSGSPIANQSAVLSRCKAWTIQVGSFEDIRNAQVLARQLNGQGMSASVESVTKDGKLKNRVQVGRHATYDQAVAALKELRKQIPDAVVTSTR